MTKTREELHEELVTILGSNSVYFQKPSSYKISYPAIVYSLSSADTKFADNSPYLHKRKYQLTLLTMDPDDELVEKITMSQTLQRVTFENHFVKDNIHHFIYRLYY